jgi:hypothetical protein
VKHIHNENNEENMKKKLKKTLKVERPSFHVHGLEELILLKCSYYPK